MGYVTVTVLAATPSSGSPLGVHAGCRGPLLSQEAAGDSEALAEASWVVKREKTVFQLELEASQALGQCGRV